MEIKKVDKTLLLSLVLGFGFSLYGIDWGWVETWEPDQMAFQNIFIEGKLPFNPGSFLKPPFHTYFNYFLSVFPLDIMGKTLHISADILNPIKLIWSRLLTTFLYLGSIILVFKITRRFFGLFAARIVSLIFATSAGLIAYSHFLTADIPVTFWMLLAFYYSQNILIRGKLVDYLLSGFFTGIATATKYNGLAIGITLVLAHVLRYPSPLWKQIFLDKKVYLGLLTILAGFIIGNPFAILDSRTFIQDFMYNYIVTPVYEGQTGNSYGKFFPCLSEIIGWPYLVFCLLALSTSLLSFFTPQNKQDLKHSGIVILLIILGIYYYKFGQFPRLETRFVLPIVPYLLILSGYLWQQIEEKKTRDRALTTSLIMILISYNIICSISVGKRFTEDPRTIAQNWVKTNVPSGSHIETTNHNPTWNKIPGVNLTEVKMPSITGRRKLFKGLFSNNQWVMEKLNKRAEDKENWYSREELLSRQPDYIAINSLYYERFLKEGKISNLYPALKIFFEQLLPEKYPYKISFDRASSPYPFWLYPQDIDFMENRITVLTKITEKNLPQNLSIIKNPSNIYGYLDSPQTGDKNLIIEKNDTLKIRGWGILPEAKQPADLVLLSYGNQPRFFASTYCNLESPDLVKVLKSSQYKRSRWEVTISGKSLPVGESVITAWVYDPQQKELAKLKGEVRIKIN